MNIFSALTQWCMMKGISFIACCIIQSKKKLYFNQLIGCTILMNCKETVIESNNVSMRNLFFSNLWLNGTLQINEKFSYLTNWKTQKRTVILNLQLHVNYTYICCRARAVRSNTRKYYISNIKIFCCLPQCKVYIVLQSWKMSYEMYKCIEIDET